jgi:hypothetical protein
MSVRSKSAASLLLLALLPAAPLPAQHADTIAPAPDSTARVHTVPRLGALIGVGSVADDALRTAQLLGRAPLDGGYLLRTPSTLTPPLAAAPGEVAWQLLAPELRTVWNSAIPFSLNDGSLWAGRGVSARLRVGARVAYGPLTLTFAPELAHAENRDFEILPERLYERQPGRSLYGWIWNNAARTIDLPWRFGDGAYTVIYPGQSALTLDAGRVAVGFSTEDQWWGPGLRNAMVLGNNAPGVPHVFLRTTTPLRTAVGDVEGRWIVGGLTESPFFDDDRSNDLRSLSGVVLTLRPAGEPNLTLGAARTVYRPVDGVGGVPLRAFDVLTQWPQRASPTDTAWAPRAQQMYAFFGRWVLPDDGFEAYLEWARHERATSLRDLLAAPNHSQGYTVGVQWARDAGPGAVRLQAEATSLEQSATFKHRPVGSFYTSRAVAQGYTHRGQGIGAAIGPGSSSQWLALDYVAGRARLGVFGTRIRWNTDAMYASRSPHWPAGDPPRSFHSYDVSLIGGVRGGVRVLGWDVAAEWSTAPRYNYLFQNSDMYFGGREAVDVVNRTAQLTISRSTELPTR